MCDRVFKAASPEDAAIREEREYPRIVEEWINDFRRSQDVRETKDGYIVRGDIVFSGLHHIPVKLKDVAGTIVCFDLTSLDNFPAKLNGNVILVNCQIQPQAIRARCPAGDYRIYRCEQI